MGHLSPLPSLTLHLPPPIPSSSPHAHVPAQHNQPLSLTQTQLCPVSSPPRKQCIDHTPFGYAQFPVCICGQAEQLVIMEHPLWGRGGDGTHLPGRAGSAVQLPDSQALPSLSELPAPCCPEPAVYPPHLWSAATGLPQQTAGSSPLLRCCRQPHSAEESCTVHIPYSNNSMQWLERRVALHKY